jgi:poly-gamma-glutamate synthesis protein (capsule biosynthesis protein)
VGGGPEGPPPENFPQYVTLVAVGDNLLHETLIAASLKNGAYDFTPLYREIQEIPGAADIAFVNQETVFAGEAAGFSGYPRFNTPKEAGNALASAGFNLVNHATNHIMDKGEAGVFSTLDYWDSVSGVEYLGIYRSEEKRKTPWVIIEKKGMRLGFLAYTYGTNGLPVPKGKPYLVSLIDTGIMAREIAALRPLCDFLVVSMHWGDEYQHTQNKKQEELAAFLAQQEVDLVIGHHPHVVQPYVNILRPDGGNMHCFYSLGNFISGQLRPSALLGALMYVRLEKKEGSVRVVEAGALPLVTHYERGSRNYKVYPLYAYTNELASSHSRKAVEKDLSPEYFETLARKVFGAIITANPFVWEEKQP